MSQGKEAIVSFSLTGVSTRLNVYLIALPEGHKSYILKSLTCLYVCAEI